MRVSAAVFIKDNHVLLFRRAPSQPYGGEWEYPGGKFECDEDGKSCLGRELREELGIDATVGNLITTVTMGKLELFAYEILNYSGEIDLRVHDKMEWVPISELTMHPQLPADLIVSEFIVNNK